MVAAGTEQIVALDHVVLRGACAGVESFSCLTVVRGRRSYTQHLRTCQLSAKTHLLRPRLHHQAFVCVF